MAPATAAAAKSALIFNTCVGLSWFTAMEETTGIRPDCSKSSIGPGSTTVTLPTSPRSTGFPSTVAPCFWARKNAPSSPEIPIAAMEDSLSNETSSRCTVPVSTMRTTFITSGLVTRRPETKGAAIPRVFSMELICGPPPCTTTGSIPHSCRKLTSWAKAALSSSEIMAFPPYLITIREPEYSRSHGKVSSSTPALSQADNSFVLMMNSPR